jgi:L-amino acid N-acyltransferase YncA
MSERFQWEKFSSINLEDSFFDSLKEDYQEFSDWYKKKTDLGANAFILRDEANNIGAFLYLKRETESIYLVDKVLPSIPRIKVGTMRIADKYQGRRFGEGALGVALWYWQKLLDMEEIYVTIFDKHTDLINLFKRFGFEKIGKNVREESVYLRSKKNISYATPYSSFPFMNPNFNEAGVLIINDVYHDTLFPYSELKGTMQTQRNIAAANGVSKVYIGSPFTTPPYKINEPVAIYRRYTKKDGQKPAYKSCVTSYCIVTNIIEAKHNGKELKTVEEVLDEVKNKSVYDEEQIRAKYTQEKHLVIIELLYLGYFGEGHNVNYIWLKNNGYFADNIYPTQNRFSKDQFVKLLEGGDIDVHSVIIN